MRHDAAKAGGDDHVEAGTASEEAYLVVEQRFKGLFSHSGLRAVERLQEGFGADRGGPLYLFHLSRVLFAAEFSHDGAAVAPASACRG
ncbi:hypothetical protein SDC9_147189 [bioreactor metagenome]|uniref:Uncharacterized protein n=1 Tax=bioreactor metagenome TaxID=1076179 RepID=A0A645ED84_9ZZZZ